MVIPGYEIQRFIAEGGMASVYLATQKSLNRPVALKILKQFERPEDGERFINEGRTIAALNQKNIITIHDVGLHDSHYYLAMEYLDSGDLASRLEKGIAPEEGLRIVQEISECLDFVHKKGIIHRDIKPANILFRDDGTPLLSDFGIAKNSNIDTNLTMDGTALGSPDYFSPEQAQGKKLDGRADIYGLGVLLFEILAGKKPYHGDNPIEVIVAHLEQPIPRLPEGVAEYQPLIDKAMAKDREERYATAAKFAVAIKKYLAEQRPIAQPYFNRLSDLHKRTIVGIGAVALVVSIALPFMKSGGLIKPSEAEQLLTLAELAFQEDRLSTPEQDNAYYYYQQVLTIQPSNEAARLGIADICDRYADLAELSLNEGDYRSAKNYVREGLKIDSGHERLRVLRNRAYSIKGIGKRAIDNIKSILH